LELGRYRDGGTQAGIRCLGRRKRVGESTDHRRFRSIEPYAGAEGRGGRKAEEAEEVASALLLTHVIIRSVADSRRAPPPVPVAVTAFGSCMLKMRAEHGAGLRPPEKGRASIVDGPRWHWPLLSPPAWSVGPAPPPEPNTIAVPSEWRFEPGAGGRAAWESRGVALTRGGLWTWGLGTVGSGQRRRGEFRRRHSRGC
jgi:hypothetical protein